MAYFENFPKILYDFSVTNGQPLNIIVTDILRRVNISVDNIRANGACEIYTILDGETPEIVSMKYYGTMDYNWLILMINNLFYGLDSFPKSYYDLENYITNVYGETGKYDVHHYEDSNGNIVNSIISGNNLKIFNPVTLNWDLFPISSYNAVTNWDYENIQNENKRNIYLLRPEFIRSVTTTINNLLAE